MAQLKHQWPSKIWSHRQMPKLANGLSRKLIMHKFSIGDCEDPVLYAAGPIYEWQQSEHGKWCMENAIGDITFYTDVDSYNYSYTIAIVGELEDVNYTFHELKWGNRK